MQRTFENDRQKRKIWKIVLLALLGFGVLSASVLAAILLGSADLSPKNVFDVLQWKLFGTEKGELSNSVVYIIWNLRLPRALLAIAAGGGLAVCGVAMQAITQNVMADPYILGVSSGATATVSFAFCIGGVFADHTGLAGFLGAIIAMVLVYFIGVSKNGASSTRLVLTGMAISIIFNAFSYLFISLSSESATRSITMWMMGSLADARWSNLLLPLLVSVAGLAFFGAQARAYNLISLGDETAVSMGVSTARLKKWTMLAVAFVTGVMVSSCGIIGLVGFVIPHIVRILLGANHRKLIPVSWFSGSIFLVWMDVLARTVLSPQELPIGIFTALFGGPFFIWLLYRQNQGE
ncbi:MAG: iron ABC transporter permease [Lachnospiraceae bacterium]|nr:iron ABC transporter permease [Lachnospiraceae bacterium]